MVSKRQFSTSSLLSYLLLALAGGATAVWALSGSRSDAEIEFRAKEARYQSQIKSLQLALQSNSTMFDRERTLAARLQRELQDANRQIDDLGRKLGIAQRTIFEKNQKLKKANLTRGTRKPGSHPRHAHLETTSALIVSRATSGIGLPQEAKRPDRKISRYSPSQSKHIRPTAKQPRRHSATVVPNRGRLPVAMPTTSHSYARVSSIGPIRVGRRNGQSRTWPLSERAPPQKETATVDQRRRRWANTIVVPPVVASPIDRAEREREADRTARRVAVARRRHVRRGRYARYSRLGRLNKRQKRRVARYRKPRRSNFVRMTLTGSNGGNH